MSLIIISLAMLLTITFFNIILGATFSSYIAGGGYGVSVGINEITGAIAIIIVLVSIAVVVGIKVFGSGISEQSVKVIIVITGYVSIWGVFSALTLNLINSIEIFGWVIYLILTIIYMVGVMNKLTNG